MLDIITGTIKPLVPGIIGAALAACIGRRLGKLHMTLSFCVGFAAASYLVGPVLHYFKLSVEDYSSGFGFIIGFFGMSMFSRLLQLVYGLDFKGIIEKRLK